MNLDLFFEHMTQTKTSPVLFLSAVAGIVLVTIIFPFASIVYIISKCKNKPNAISSGVEAATPDKHTDERLAEYVL